MGYTLEDIRASQEIFCYLLEKHELRAEEAPLLFKAYTESEDVQALLSSQSGRIPDSGRDSDYSPSLFL